jgi:hypothetical protein
MAWAVAATAAVAFAHPAALDGQFDGSPPRMFVGGSLSLAQPTGEFNEYVNVGGGVSGFFRVAADPDGILSFRVDVSALTYGRETRQVCLSSTVGCRITVDLTTSNNIFLLGVGPELAVPVGGGRLYGGLTGGLGYFLTDSSVSGTGDQQPFAQSENYSDAGFAWNAGGGIQIPITRGRIPVALDFGVSYQGNGRREYLTRGDIIDLPGGDIELRVRESDADFALWRLGVSVGLRKGEDG